MTNCFICNKNICRKNEYYICENNHIIEKHKLCVPKQHDCSVCNAKLIGYSKYKINNKNIPDAKLNFNKKYKYVKHANYIFTINNIKQILIKYKCDNFSIDLLTNTIYNQILQDDICIDNFLDLEYYIFFILNKPN